MTQILREATADDRDILFAWTNDEKVRQNSFSANPVSYEEHIKWFEKIMDDCNVIQWIFQEDGKPIGQIRFSINGETAEVGYSICAEYRGRGMGTLMLQMAAEKIHEENPKIKKIIAKVKTGNEVSRKAFLSNGYKSVFEQLEYELV